VIDFQTMTAHKKLLCLVFLALGIFHQTSGQAEAIQTPQNLEFFESRIRPVLAQDCYECHQSNGTKKGGLALDYREGLLKGGHSGPASFQATQIRAS
jgi:mono/diheme cytochrome c family protein